MPLSPLVSPTTTDLNFVPIVDGYFTNTLPGTSQSAQTLIADTGPSTVSVLFTYNIHVTNAGTAGTVTATCLFTDEIGTGSTSFGPFSLSATGRHRNSIILTCAPNTTLGISTTAAGVGGSPSYTIYATITRLATH